jgi:hypothetical protein
MTVTTDGERGSCLLLGKYWSRPADQADRAALSLIVPEPADFLDGHEFDLLGKACAIERH